MSDGVLGQDRDVAFGFNPRPFLAGLKQAQTGMTGLVDTARKVSDMVTTRIIAIKAAWSGFQRAVRAVAAQMPEIGQAFTFARDVILKNLLWPLRQAIMPYLQRMLDWVQTHRTQFVKWGAALANIFRALMIVGKQVWQIIKDVGNVFGTLFRQITGGGLDNFINLVSVKLAAVMLFIGNIIQRLMPTFQLLSQLFGTLAGIVGDIIRPLFEGFKNSALFDEDKMGGATGAINGIISSITNLAQSIRDFVNKPEVQKLLKLWGQLFGDEIQLILLNFQAVIEGVTDALQWLIYGITALVEIAKGTDWSVIGQMATDLAAQQGKRWEQIGNNYKRLGANIGSVIKGALGLGGAPVPGSPTPMTPSGVVPSYLNVKDALVTKRGDVVRFDPGDTIMAARNPGRIFGGGLPAQQISIALTVTEGNARAAGEEFSRGLQNGFRTTLLDDQLAGGG